MDPKSSPDKEIVKEEVDVPIVDQEDAKPSAKSSEAEPGEKGDMLSAVKAALKPQETSPASDEPGPKAEDPPAATPEKAVEEGDGSGDLTAEETSRLKPKTRQRIEYLSHQVKERDTKLADMTPKAERFEQIAQFVEEAGLSKDDVNSGFDIMRNLKSNPVKAYDQLRPIMDQLESVLGHRLPPELEAQVNQGQLTEAHARELSRSRATATVTGKVLQETETRQKQAEDKRKFEAQVDETAKAVTEWETKTGQGDPDWKLKQPRVQALVELEIMRKQQRDPEYFPSKDEAVSISKKALETVEAELKPLNPRRRQINVPASDAGSTASVASPKSMMDAVKNGLAKMAG